MAGLNGAGLAGTDEGMLGAQARAQYAALLRLRWHMFTNGLRSNNGALELGARTFSFALYTFLGLGLGLGVGAAAYLLASNEEWRFLPFLFWAVFLIWQMAPVILASLQEQFDLGILLRFPLRFGSYFLLYLLFGLVDSSTILGGLCCVGIWVGITVARPELSAWTALGLGIFAAFNILLVRAIFAWIDRWLAQRKTREILGAVFMVFMLSVQLLNPALRQNRHPAHASQEEQSEAHELRQAQLKEKYGPWLRTAHAVQAWLPPGLAARALQSAAMQPSEPEAGLGWLGVLGLYMLAAAGVLGARLGAEYRGESLGQAPRPKLAAASRANLPRADLARRERGWLPHGSGPVSAVMEKELRALLRTLPLLYAIGAPLLLVVVFSTLFLKGGAPEGHVFPLALPVCMVYAQLGFTQMFYNNLGAEGAGIQLYFLSPTPIRTVLLAKNLFHSVLFALVALLAAVLTSLRLGVPDGQVAAATGAWLLFALPSNLAAGNVFSLTMPYRLNPGRLTRQRGSQANALLSLLLQVGVMAIGAAVFYLGWRLGRLWLAVPIFLALSVGATSVWLRVLGHAEAMANRRRDALIATLMKTQ